MSEPLAVQLHRLRDAVWDLRDAYAFLVMSPKGRSAVRAALDAEMRELRRRASEMERSS